MTYQTLYDHKKIPLVIAVSNGVVILRAEDQVPHNEYVLVARAFPRAKNTNCLKCEWEDFTDKKVGGVRWKIRIFNSTTSRPYARSPLVGLST
jgi:hypothetical protein